MDMPISKRVHRSDIKEKKKKKVFHEIIRQIHKNAQKCFANSIQMKRTEKKSTAQQ